MQRNLQGPAQKNSVVLYNLHTGQDYSTSTNCMNLIAIVLNLDVSECFIRWLLSLCLQRDIVDCLILDTSSICMNSMLKT